MSRLSLWVLYFIMLTLLACKDNADSGNVIKIDPVSNVRYESGPGELLFKWDNPTDLAYVQISFVDGVGENRKVLVDGKLSSKSIYGLADEVAREYAFVAFNSTGNCSDTVVINAQPELTPFNALQNSLVVKTNLTGVDVEWNNTQEGEFYIEISYLDGLNLLQSKEVVVQEIGKGKESILLGGIYQTSLNVSIVDVYGNRSNVESFPFKKLESGRLDRGVWQIVDFDSEEAGGEGDYPKGYADAVLDGNPTTFWHSKWSNLPPGFVVKYPHWLTFDLMREVKLWSAEINERIDQKYVTDIQILGSPSKSGPWTKIKDYKLLNTNNTQTILFDDTVSYRFIKMDCVKGNNVHACMAEFALYGEDIVDN